MNVPSSLLLSLIKPNSYTPFVLATWPLAPFRVLPAIGNPLFDPLAFTGVVTASITGAGQVTLQCTTNAASTIIPATPVSGDNIYCAPLFGMTSLQDLDPNLFLVGTINNVTLVGIVQQVVINTVVGQESAWTSQIEDQAPAALCLATYPELNAPCHHAFFTIVSSVSVGSLAMVLPGGVITGTTILPITTFPAQKIRLTPLIFILFGATGATNALGSIVSPDSGS
jgi:hypothetical protein